MAVQVTYRPPAVNPLAALLAYKSAAEHAGAEVLLAASQPLVPVDEDVLKKSGRVETGEGVSYVTYGRDDDGKYAITGFQHDGAATGTEKHAPSNQYAVIVHEDMDAHHEHGGQAKYLETPMNTEAPAIVAAVAVVLAKAL